MALLTFDEVSLAFGAHKILRQTDFAIEPGERVCLIGRNGAGKTTVLRLIAGTLEPDHGEVIRQSGLEISRLEQTLPVMTDVSVAEYVAGGLQRLRGLIAEYEARARTDLDDIGVRELEALQRNIETHGGWNIDQRVATVLSELDIPPDKHLNELSGGWQRRVALAKALVNRPELLLLDEPTNHLDLHTIQWLEKRVRNYPGSVLFITHDRAFLQKLATRIVDIDRGQIKSWPGDYRAYRRGKEKAMEDERRHNGLFDKKLAEEEIWVRQGLKARRTRNEGRVRALQSMRDERAQRIKPDGQARIHVEEAERSGRKVIDARNLHFRYGEQPLIEGLSVRIMRGDRIGLIGNNGVGKSTLLNILLGRLQPQAGTVKLGTNLKLGYFDQVRRILDPTRTVAEFVGDGRDYIKLNGKERHVIGYLRGFLFSANRAMEPLSVLSGGERNRVILAKLFTRPTNLLVLDEPTNDLDVETLEVLEERLAEYAGTLIVVSHDRAFLDNVVTSTLVFENAGEIRRYAGGYNDWLKQGHSLTHVDDPDDDVARPAASANTTSNEQRRKLSYKLKHELEQLPNRIELLEKELDELHGQTNRRGFFDQPFEATQPLIDRLRACQGELDDAMMRWSELETMQSELSG